MVCSPLNKAKRARQIMNITNINVPDVIKEFSEVSKLLINDILPDTDVNEITLKIENTIIMYVIPPKKGQVKTI